MNMSEIMRKFVNTRYNAGDVDSDLAYYLLYAAEPSDKKPDYLDLTLVEGQPRITYILPEKAAGLSDEERFTKRGLRVIGRPASVVQKVIGKEQNGHAMDRFVQSAGVFLTPPDETRFVILSGEDVWLVFNRKNTCYCNAYNMIRSCMTGEGDQHKDRPGLGFYEEFCQIACMTCPKCGKYESRTILWTDASGKQFHDRIYGTARADHELGTLLQARGVQQLRYRYDKKGEAFVLMLTPETMAKYDKLGFPSLDSVNYRCDTCVTLSNEACPDYKGNADRYAGGRSWNYGSRSGHGAPNPLINRLGGANDAEAAGSEEARA